MIWRGVTCVWFWRLEDFMIQQLLVFAALPAWRVSSDPSVTATGAWLWDRWEKTSVSCHWLPWTLPWTPGLMYLLFFSIHHTAVLRELIGLVSGNEHLSTCTWCRKLRHTLGFSSQWFLSLTYICNVSPGSSPLSLHTAVLFQERALHVRVCKIWVQLKPACHSLSQIITPNLPVPASLQGTLDDVLCLLKICI